jgi:hypothetical protein
VGTVPASLARDLKRRLEIGCGVETGTYTGGGALLLSDIFGSVTTIELSEELASEAAAVLRFEPIRVIQGDSRDVLRPSTQPTFYYLDGHWSGGRTAGEGVECPLLGELDAISGGHADDCIVIDDARLFVDSRGSRVNEYGWPSLDEVRERVARYWPEHAVVLGHDQIVVVPAQAADLAEAFASRPAEVPGRDQHPIRRLKRALRKLQRLLAVRLARTRPAPRARG